MIKNGVLLFIWIFILQFSVVSCVKNKETKNNDLITNITQKLNIVKYSDCFELVEKIQLETIDHCYLSDNPSFFIMNNGSIVVIDYFLKQVFLFSKNGHYIKNIGRYGQGPGEFLYPTFGYFDELNRFYIYDRDLLRINVYDSLGNFINSNNYLKYFSDVAINSKKEKYFYSNGFIDEARLNIVKYTKDNKIIKQFGKLECMAEALL